MPGRPRNEVNRALADAGPDVAAPSSWGAARQTLFGGSTARTAEAAGVSQRSVQRWIAAEEGRTSQTRRPNATLLGGVGRRASLERIRDGAPVSYAFSGNISGASGGHRGRSGRVRTQTRDTRGFVDMDPDGARAWARAELDGDPSSLDYLSDAMFGDDSGYPIPGGRDYAGLEGIDRFELRIG